jgi:hypothetical protein
MSHDKVAIADDAGLLRRIHPDQVIDDKNLGKIRPSSGAFKDRELSVDAEPILHKQGLDWTFSLRNHTGFSLVRFPAHEARALGLQVVHDPEPDNVAHTLVVGTKSRRLADHFVRVSDWVHLEPKKP